MVNACMWHKLGTQRRCKLTPNSQRAHMNYLTVGSFWGCTVSSQQTHKMSSPCSGSSELTVWVVNSRKAQSKLTLWGNFASSLWPTECTQMSPPWDNSGELSVSGVLAHTFTGKQSKIKAESVVLTALVVLKQLEAGKSWCTDIWINLLKAFS